MTARLAAPLAYLVLASVAVASWYGGAQLVWGDDATHPLSLSRTDTYFRLLDPGLGAGDGRKFPFILPLGAMLEAWRWLHVPYSLTVLQPVVVVLLLSASAFSMFWLVRVLAPWISGLGAFGGGLFYAFNIYAATTIWSSMAYLCIHYALLPAVVVGWVVAQRRTGLPAAVLAGTAWAVALTPAYITTPVAVTDIALFSAVSVVLCLTAPGRRLRTASTAVGTFAVWLAFALFWIVPLTLTTSAVTATGLSAGNSVHLLSQNSAPLTDALRLGGYWGVTSSFLGYPYFAWSHYYSQIGLAASTAVPVAAVVGAAFWLRRRGNRAPASEPMPSRLTLWFALGLALCALFLITGTHQPLGALKREAVVDLGLAGPFRSVYQRFGVYLTLAYGPLVAGGIAAVQMLVVRASRSRLATGAGVVAALAATAAVAVVPAWPMWSGKIMDETGSVPARRVTVPNDYLRVARLINETPGDFDVLTLPYGGLGTITLHWSTTNSGFYDRATTRGYNGIEPLRLLVHKGVLTSDATAPYTKRWAATVVKAGSHTATALRLLNARFVVLHLDENLPYLTGSGRWTGLGIRHVGARLDRLRFLRVVYASTTLRVYAVRDWRPFRVFALRMHKGSGRISLTNVRPLPYREEGLAKLVVDTRHLHRREVVVVNRPFDDRWRGNGRPPARVAPGLPAFSDDRTAKLVISYPPERTVRRALLLLPTVAALVVLVLGWTAIRKRRRPR